MQQQGNKQPLFGSSGSGAGGVPRPGSIAPGAPLFGPGSIAPGTRPNAGPLGGAPMANGGPLSGGSQLANGGRGSFGGGGGAAYGTTTPYGNPPLQTGGAPYGGVPTAQSKVDPLQAGVLPAQHQQNPLGMPGNQPPPTTLVPGSTAFGLQQPTTPSPNSGPQMDIQLGDGHFRKSAFSALDTVYYAASTIQSGHALPTADTIEENITAKIDIPTLLEYEKYVGAAVQNSAAMTKYKRVMKKAEWMLLLGLMPPELLRETVSGSGRSLGPVSGSGDEEKGPVLSGASTADEEKSSAGPPTDSSDQPPLKTTTSKDSGGPPPSAGAAPATRNLWLDRLRSLRTEYANIKEKYKTDLASTAAKAKKNPAKFNPLAKTSPTTDENLLNPWEEVGVDENLRNVIRLDVERTYSDVPLFLKDSTRSLLSAILFHWCKGFNPSRKAGDSYRQGMNEIAAVCFQVVYDSRYLGSKSNFLKEFGSENQLEADTFILFQAVMGSGFAPLFAVAPPPQVVKKETGGDSALVPTLGGQNILAGDGNGEVVEVRNVQTKILDKCKRIMEELLLKVRFFFLGENDFGVSVRKFKEVWIEWIRTWVM